MEVPTLVDAAWLKEHLPSVKVVDCSWHLPMTKRIARDEYPRAHIPGAIFFDLDLCCDKEAKYGEQMLPPVGQFEQYMSELGISNADHLVLYDNNENMGMFSAPRSWYMFRVFGHEKVSVLNGGLPHWKDKGGQVTSELPTRQPSTYKATFNSGLVKSYEDVLRNIETNEFLYVDARPNLRFIGQAPEPIPGVKPGHIVDTINLPFPQFLGGQPKVMKPVAELQAIFKSAGVDLDKPTVMSCGSGMTASIVLLAAYLCGHKDIPLYDGAWAEWFLRADAKYKADVPSD